MMGDYKPAFRGKRVVGFRATGLLMVAALAAGGCGPNGINLNNIGNQEVFAGIGAIGGGLLGSQFGDGAGQIAMTGIGALVGGMIGSEFGRWLDDRDRQQVADAAADAYRTGQPQYWSNPESGNSGVVRPVTAQRASSQPNAQSSTRSIQVAEAGPGCQIHEARTTLSNRATDTSKYKICETSPGVFSAELLARDTPTANMRA